MVSLRTLQLEIERWLAAHPDRTWPPLANLARLTEEVGELARVLNQRHGPKRRKPGEPPADAQRAAEELGDVVAVCLVLATSLGIDLEAATVASLERARHRTPAGPREPGDDDASHS